MPIEKKNLHTVHCTHARTLRALALCRKGLSKIFQNIYETRPWPALRAGGPRWDRRSNTVQVGTFWDCLYDSLRAFGAQLGLEFGA